MRAFVFAFAAVAFSQLILAENEPAGHFGQCPEVDGEDPVYLLDLKHPHVFYECSNGQPILQWCASGLVFNPKNNNCDHAIYMNESCGAVGNCPEDDGDSEVLLRDACDFSTFHRCNNSEAVAESCPEGLFFNAYLQECSRH